jgi:hypothetical protein
MKKSISIVGYGVLLLIGIFCMCVCLSGGLIPIPYTNERLQQLNNMDWIEIRIFFPPNYEPVYTKKITDPKKVNVAIEKIRTYSDYWFSPLIIYFRPQYPVAVSMGRNDAIKAESCDSACSSPSPKALEGFDIGNRNGFLFIATWSGGRYLSTNEFKELMAVLDIDENCAHLSGANPTCNTDGLEKEPPFISFEGY